MTESQSVCAVRYSVLVRECNPLAVTSLFPLLDLSQERPGHARVGAHQTLLPISSAPTLLQALL